MCFRFLAVLAVCCCIISCFSMIVGLHPLAWIGMYVIAAMVALMPFLLAAIIRWPKYMLMNPEDYVAAEKFAKMETVLRGLCEHSMNTEQLVQQIHDEMLQNLSRQLNEVHHQTVASRTSALEEYFITAEMLDKLSDKIVEKLTNV